MNPHPFETVALRDDPCALVIIDQTLLPLETKYLTLTTADEIREAIKSLRVRGAPAIGIAAAIGLYVRMYHALHKKKPENFAEFERIFTETKNYLSSSRPTAVNLNWALEKMSGVFYQNRNEPADKILSALRDTAVRIKEEDARVCRSIGEYGAELLKPGMGILTHCNAGALATSMYGTALAPVYVCKERGVPLRVFADETRPLLQGARLTAYELYAAGVDVTLICDNMASSVMQKGWIDAVFVGCDRVAANGDAANKIGTSGVAVLAAAYGIPFYVCAPFSTIDPETPDGGGIVIEERDSSEVTDKWYANPVAPRGVKVYNPAFDVTPAKYISAFVTERGILYPPYDFRGYTFRE
ncbi:MAG: S-methyl-5-thioribose-1-phosphate isomerase [Clostridiales bacterium]|jgi:methylthioribose-1-phosphate isomerase|nr:S-methyl-5-thioribose-1-phosphate isomerase [Clostridiales bacterium]